MMRTGYILHCPTGPVVSAIVYHCDGRTHSLMAENGQWSPGSGELYEALQIVADDLDASHAGMPAPVLNRLAWLSRIAIDDRTTGQSKRIAGLIAKLRPGEWLGIHAIASELRMDFRNVPRSVGLLVRLGYLTKSRDGHRVLFTRTLP